MILALVASCTFVTDEEWAGREVPCDTEGLFVDADADGWGSTAATSCDDVANSVNRVGDCDDGDATVYPLADDVPYDGVDSDCAGDGDYDLDGDGYDAVLGGGTDCWDRVEDPVPALEGDCAEPNLGTLTPADVYPGATDQVYDGVDADCSGGTDFDADRDGFASCLDCDDADPARFPNDADEVWYNGYDENCDGNDGDQDGDGYVVENYPHEIPSHQLPGDCWDDPLARPEEMRAINDFPDVASTDVHASGTDTWYDGVDQDCAGNSDFDQDGDGDDTDAYPSRDGALGGDCDDLDPEVYSGADETWYDDFDQDCAGDDDFDQDGDGDSSSRFGGADCDDLDASVSSLAREACASTADEDCDGEANEAGADGCTDYYADADGDGYGGYDSNCLCLPDANYFEATAEDCDDADGTVNPGVVETCATATDDDCDGSANEIDALACAPWYRDADADGLGDTAYVCACEGIGLYSATASTDCDDTDPSIAETITFYADADGDGYGDASSITGDCVAPAGFVADPTDCDDEHADANPAGTETCADSYDNDCDGSSNDEGAEGCGVFWADLDADGYAGTSACLCDAEGDYVYETDGGDCDDGSAPASPGAGESCMDGADGGCDEHPGTCAVSGTVDLGVLQHQWAGASSALGASVAGPGDIEGDGPVEMLVGAADADGGRVYAISYGEPSSVLDAAWILAAVGAGDDVGASLAGLGDIDGDGYRDVAVGAPGVDGTGAGGVFFGPLSGSAAMTDSPVYLLGDALGDDAFRSVSGLGDPDGDGIRGLAAGAPGDDSGGTDAGKAWVVLSAVPVGTSSLSSEAGASWRGEYAGDGAGTVVLGDHDLSGDGLGDLVVGAPGADWSAADGGTVYMAFGPFGGGSVLSAADLSVDGLRDGGGLGAGPVAAADLDGDGRNDLVVTDPGHDAGGSAAGAVFVIDGSSTGPIDTSYAYFRVDGSADDGLGTSLSVGDFDRDGVEDLLVGLPGYDGSATDTGGVAVFLGPLATTTTTASSSSAMYTGAVPGDGAGGALGWLGDVDGDGTADFGVGAPDAEGGLGIFYVLRGGGY